MNYHNSQPNILAPRLCKTLLKAKTADVLVMGFLFIFLSCVYIYCVLDNCYIQTTATFKGKETWSY